MRAASAQVLSFFLFCLSFISSALLSAVSQPQYDGDLAT